MPKLKAADNRESYKRILALDIGACQYCLGLIAQGMTFLQALGAAENYQKEQEQEQE